ncbi:hypothetical protein LAZ67_X000882 [Cordylochernes scorpioides]|uniref:Transposase n=1 Tax=Cordylochernes scorpioides TaxID=51811 RepID=A0ABY6LS06_9ARAC|nr:hypothetical protein LAZ67_X000882 [Cordylochernes scorpioides]
MWIQLYADGTAVLGKSKIIEMMREKNPKGLVPHLEESHERLMKALGDKAPSIRTVFIGLMNLNLLKLTLKMNLVQVDHQQQEDRRITYQQLEKSVGIGSEAISTIFNDHLKYRKLVSRWVPHSLTEEQKLGCVKWCNFMLKKFDEGKSKAVTKLGFTILIQKQNGNLLFGALQNHLLLRKFAELEVLENKWSLVFLEEIERQLIVTGIQQNAFQQYLKNIKQSRPRAQLRGVLLHHDNARPHTSAQTLLFSQLWCLISHSSTIFTRPSTL